MSTDLEREIRETLRARAGHASAPMEIPRPVRRRARRRRIGSAIGSSLVVAGVVAGAVVGMRALFAPGPPPAVRIGGAEAFAVWPQTTREGAEAAQARADEGDPESAWQADAEEVVERFTAQELGWEEVFFLLQGSSEAPDDLLVRPIGHELDVTLRDEVTLWVSISECGPPDLGPCGGADLYLERLLRPDSSGVWFVTAATVTEERFVGATPMPSEETESPGRPLPRSLDDRIAAFMEARYAGSGAKLFLTEGASFQYEEGLGGLSLYGYTTDPGTSYAVRGWEDRGSPAREIYSVMVTIRNEGTTVATELLGLSSPICDPGVTCDFDYTIHNAKRIE